MHFAVSLPWWALVLIAGAAVAAAWGAYAGARSPLRGGRRAALVALRTAVLLALVSCLLRPVQALPPDTAADSVVPILVDVSRSMSLRDAGDRRRIEAAGDAVDGQILPSLAGRFAPELWTFGDALQPAPTSSAAGGADPSRRWVADARRSDLSGALRDIGEHYRGRRLAGIVVLSDGGDTGAEDAAAAVNDATVPVFTVGIGPARGAVDYEVLDVAAGDATVVDAAVDVTVSAVSRGSEAPFDLRLLENGRPIDVRRVVPSGVSSPVRVVFTVSPAKDAATLYAAEIPSSSSEAVVENNRRSIVVEPPGRVRRVLMIAGAPGFEHSFLKRALDMDPAIELDSVVRKGRDTSGEFTYFIQAPAERAPLLVSGFPKERAALYAYDAIVLANVEPDTLTGAQLAELAAFVEHRGGGLLVLGARSFAHGGLAGTPLEEVLPVTLSTRDAVVVRAASSAAHRAGGERVARGVGVIVTSEGAMHPAMRIAPTADAAIRRWEAVPSLAAASSIGEPRAGAQVLALVRTSDGTRPLVAVQRYGQGRSMVFAGEASWRWRMMMPSTDRTYEVFWRQAARWLSSSAPGRVTIPAVPSLIPGDEGTLSAEIRNEEFEPVADAAVALRVITPSGATADLRPVLTDPATGRYSSPFRFDEPGLYRVSAATRQSPEGGSQRSILVGAVDREMTDPRLNEDVLRRVSRATGGQYLDISDASTLHELLTGSDSQSAPPRVRELWHGWWVFAVIVAMLSAEWMLRRRWGLR
jgi:uncharacterized membrane protein